MVSDGNLTGVEVHPFAGRTRFDGASI
jgi:hypothetical protein